MNRFLKAGNVVFNEQTQTFQFVSDVMGPETMIKYGLNHCPNVICGQVNLEGPRKVHWTDIDHHVFLENVGKPLNGPSLLAQEDMLESEKAFPEDHPLHYTLLPIRKMQEFSLNPQEPPKVPVPKRIGARGSMRDALNQKNSGIKPEIQVEVPCTTSSNRSKKKANKEMKELSSFKSNTNGSPKKQVFNFEEFEGKLKKMKVEKTYKESELINKRIISLLCEIVQKSMRKNVSFHHEVVPNEEKFSIVLNVETEKFAKAITNISGGVNSCKVLLSAHSMVRISPDVYREWYYANKKSTDPKNIAELRLIQEFFEENEEELMRNIPPYQLVPKGTPSLLKGEKNKHTQQTQSDNETDTTTTHHSSTAPMGRDYRLSPFKENNGFIESRSSPLTDKESVNRFAEQSKHEKKIKKEKIKKTEERKSLMMIEKEAIVEVKKISKHSEKKIRESPIMDQKGKKTKSKGKSSKMVIEKIGKRSIEEKVTISRQIPCLPNCSNDNSTEYIDFMNPISPFGEAKKSIAGKKSKKSLSPMLIEEDELEQKPNEVSMVSGKSQKKSNLSQQTEVYIPEDLNMSIGKLSIPGILGMDDNLGGVFGADMDGVMSLQDFQTMYQQEEEKAALGLMNLDLPNDNQISLKSKQNKNGSPSQQSNEFRSHSGKITGTSVTKDQVISIGRSGVLDLPVENNVMIELENAGTKELSKDISQMGKKLSVTHPKQDLIAILKKLLEEPYFNLSLLEIYEKSKTCSEGRTLKDFMHRIANYLTVKERGTPNIGPDIKVLLFNYAKNGSGYILYKLIFNGEVISEGERNILDLPVSESFGVICSLLMKVFKSDVKIQEILEAMIMDLYDKVLILENSKEFLIKKAQEAQEMEAKAKESAEKQKKKEKQSATPKHSTTSFRNNGNNKWNGGISPRMQEKLKKGDEKSCKDQQPGFYDEAKASGWSGRQKESSQGDSWRDIKGDNDEKYDGLLNKIKMKGKNRQLGGEGSAMEHENPSKGPSYMDGIRDSRDQKRFDDKRHQDELPRNMNPIQSRSHDRYGDRSFEGRIIDRRQNDRNPDRYRDEDSHYNDRHPKNFQDKRRDRHWDDHSDRGRPNKDGRPFQKYGDHNYFDRSQEDFKRGSGPREFQGKFQDSRGPERGGNPYREERYNKEKNQRDREKPFYNSQGRAQDDQAEDGEISGPQNSGRRDKRGQSAFNNRSFSKGPPPYKGNKFWDHRDKDRDFPRNRDDPFRYRDEKRGNNHFQSKFQQKGEHKKNYQMNALKNRDSSDWKKSSSSFHRGPPNQKDNYRPFNNSDNYESNRDYGGRDYERDNYDYENRRGFYGNQKETEFDGGSRPNNYRRKWQDDERDYDGRPNYDIRKEVVREQGDNGYLETSNYDIQIPKDTFAPNTSQVDIQEEMQFEFSPSQNSDKNKKNAQSKKKDMEEESLLGLDVEPNLNSKAKGKNKGKSKKTNEEKKPKTKKEPKPKARKAKASELKEGKPSSNEKGSCDYLQKRNSASDRFQKVDDPVFSGAKMPKQIKTTTKKSKKEMEAESNPVILLE